MLIESRNRLREENPSSSQERHKANERKSDRQLEQQKRQPYAALTSARLQAENGSAIEIRLLMSAATHFNRVENLNCT